jgi:hypothetical protein
MHGPVAITGADFQLIFDFVETQNHWQRVLSGLLLDAPFQHWHQSCLPAFIINGFLQRRPEVFHRLKRCNAWRVCIFRHKTDLFLLEFELLFVKGGYAINSAAYIRILPRTVVPFIRANQGNQYWFWMDLASAHYANATLAFLQQEKIRFVPKDANPPSVASLWPVEDFWAALKKAVYDEGWEATSMSALKRRIKQKARQIPLPMILSLQHNQRSIGDLCPGWQLGRA